MKEDNMTYRRIACSKINSCEKVKQFFDREMTDPQLIAGIEQTCDACPDYTETPAGAFETAVIAAEAAGEKFRRILYGTDNS